MRAEGEQKLLDRITVNPDIFGGKPIVRGQRIAVEHILGMITNGSSHDEIIARYPFIEKEDVQACLVYAARANSTEITTPPVKLDPRQVEVVDDQIAEILKNKTPAERLRIGFDIWESTHRMLLFHVKNTHPEWTPQEVEREVARRLLHGAI